MSTPEYLKEMEERVNSMYKSKEQFLSITDKYLPTVFNRVVENAHDGREISKIAIRELPKLVAYIRYLKRLPK